MNRFASVVALTIALTAAFSSRVPAQEPPSPAGQDRHGLAGFGAQDEKPKSDPKLVAIGGLSASTLYMSFLLVGITADNFGKGVYEADRVKQLCTEVTGMLKKSAEQISACKEGLSDVDLKYVDEMLAGFGMVQDYAKLLSDFTKDKDDKVAEAFQAKRKETWERIKKLLGIK